MWWGRMDGREGWNQVRVVNVQQTLRTLANRGGQAIADRKTTLAVHCWGGWCRRTKEKSQLADDGRDWTKKSSGSAEIDGAADDALHERQSDVH